MYVDSIYTQRFLGNWKGKFKMGPNIILATSNAFLKFKCLTWKHVVLVQAIQPRSQGKEAMRLAGHLLHVKYNIE